MPQRAGTRQWREAPWSGTVPSIDKERSPLRRYHREAGSKRRRTPTPLAALECAGGDTQRYPLTPRLPLRSLTDCITYVVFCGYYGLCADRVWSIKLVEETIKKGIPGLFPARPSKTRFAKVFIHSRVGDCKWRSILLHTRTTVKPSFPTANSVAMSLRAVGMDSTAGKK